MDTKHTKELKAINAELISCLKEAVECVAYCRRSHKDIQSGEGFPVEMRWKAALSRATATTT